VFFEVNTVHANAEAAFTNAVPSYLSVIQLSMVWKLEVSDCCLNGWMRFDCTLADVAKEKLALLPQLKELTLAYDDMISYDHKTLQQALLPCKLHQKIEWVNIGLAHLNEPDLGIKIYLKHIGLRFAWSRVHKPAYPSKVSQIESLFNSNLAFAFGIDPAAREVTYEGMPVWLAGYEGWRSIMLKGGLDEKDAGSLAAREFAASWGGTLRTFKDVPGIHPKLEHGLLLKDLDASKHDPELIGWVSELSVLNIIGVS